MTPGKTYGQSATSQDHFEALAEEQRRLAEIGRIVSSSLDLEEALSEIVEQTRSLVPFDRIVINGVNDDLTKSHILFANDARPDAPPDKDHVPYIPTTIAIEALRNQVEYVANGREHDAYLEQLLPEQKLNNSGFNSFLLVPLVWQGRAIGSLSLRSAQTSPYGASEVSLAKQMAAQIAGAIASFNQRTVIEKESEDRQKLADEQARIAEIGRIVSSTLNLDEALTAFVEQTRSLVPFDRIVINAANDDLTELRDLFIDDTRQNPPSDGNYAPYRATAFAHEALVNQVPFVANGPEHELYLEPLLPEQKRRGRDFNSFLLVPLIWQGSTIGALNLRSRQVDPYSPTVVSLAKQIGAQIAGAIASFNQRTVIEKELEDRQKLADEQARIAEIGRIVSSTLDINEVFDVFAEQAQHLVPWDRVIIAAISEDRSHLIDKFVTGIDVDGPRPPLGALSRDEVFTRIFTEKKQFSEGNQTLASGLPAGIRRAEALNVGLRSILITPLIWKGEVVGVLTFRSTDPTAYDDHHSELALQISQQIAGAIATADQYALVERESEERQALAKEQSRIAEIGRIVSSTLDVHEVLEAFVEQARALVPIDRIVITEVDLENDRVVDIMVDGLVISGDDTGNPHSLKGDSLHHQVITQRQNFVANREEYIELTQRDPAELERHDTGLRSILVVPMVWQGQCFGTMNLRSADANAYGEREIELAEQIAAQIAGAISTSKQYAITQLESQERRRLAEEQSRIAEIGRIVSSTLDIDDVLEAFVDEARALVPFDRIVVTSINDELTSWVAELGVGIRINAEKIGVAQPINAPSTQTKVVSEQWKFAANGEEYMDYVKANPRELELYDAGLRSILLIPLVWQGKCFGSMNLRSIDPDAYGEHEIELAEQIGAQIAGAFATSSHVRLLEAAATATQTQVAALEAAGEAVVIRGLDVRIEYANKAFEEQTGYTAEEVIGQDPEYLNPGVSLPDDFIDRMWEQAQSGQSVQSTFVGTHKNGTKREFDATLSPIFNDEGKIIKFVGIRRDVTERSRAENDIRTQAAALDAAGDSVIILSPDTSIEWVNEAFVRFSGYSKEEAIGQTSPFLRSEKDPAELFEGLWDQVQNGKPWSGRTWVRTKSGTEYQAESSFTPVVDDDGNINRIIAIMRDITDLVQAEKDREATRDLDAQNQQLLELNEQREEFFSTVSHELRTPLTAVMAFADILTRNRDGTLSNLQLEHLDVIKRNSKNLNALVEDMLDFSQLTTDRLKLDKNEFEIHSLLESVVESLEPTANQRGQFLEIKPHTSPIWITADSGRISQVISNLITNSCKYSPTATRIALAAELRDQQAVLTVTDQGHGIPEDDLEQIFSPFFRADQTAIREEIGTGLGLAISKTLIDLHDGTIEAFSELGEGTEIKVTLPGATTAPTTAEGS